MTIIWHEAMVSKLRSMRQQQKSLADIAYRLGVSTRALVGYCRKNGISTKRVPSKPRPPWSPNKMQLERKRRVMRYLKRLPKGDPP